MMLSFVWCQGDAEREAGKWEKRKVDGDDLIFTVEARSLHIVFFSSSEEAQSASVAPLRLIRRPLVPTMSLWPGRAQFLIETKEKGLKKRRHKEHEKNRSVLRGWCWLEVVEASRPCLSFNKRAVRQRRKSVELGTRQRVETQHRLARGLSVFILV